jgi:hypothetical protein
VLGLADTSAADRLVPDQVGFYEVRGSQGVRWLAVNVDARESDLAHLPKDFIARWRALRASKPAQTTAAAAPDAPKPAASQSLGTLLLWLAAALLFVELLLANHHLAIRREAPR